MSAFALICPGQMMSNQIKVAAKGTLLAGQAEEVQKKNNPDDGKCGEQI
jgi:hypothetical protein